MGYIEEFLSESQQKYRDAVAMRGNDAESVKRLKEMTQEISRQAQKYIVLCEQQIEDNNNFQKKCLDKRADLYEKCQNDKRLLSDLDAERVKIAAGISDMQIEISKSKQEISNLAKEQEKRKKDKEYWEKVWWATCWIPFANIGTGIKWSEEDNQYKVRVRQIQNNISHMEQRIGELNSRMQEICRQQAKNKESSGKLANEIMAVNGEISRITEQINQLRNEMVILRMIESANRQIDAVAEFSNDSIRVIKETIAYLNEVKNEMQSRLLTTKYVNGCTSRGDRLLAGEILNQNECLLSSNKRFAAIMQADNNFVVYNSERPLWSSGTWAAEGRGRILFDTKGLIRLEGTSMRWDTKREGAAVLIMQDDGNLVAYKENHEPVWASDTYTYAREPGICFLVTS